MSRGVAFVTGASRGIGKASALALADAGFDVVVTARTVAQGEQYDYGTTRDTSGARALPGSLEETAARIRERGRQALPIRLDLLDRASIDAAVDQAVARLGRIDVLLNNGIYQGPGVMDRFLELSEPDLRRVFEGNVFAQLHLTRRVLAPMLERGAGIVINMSSTAGRSSPDRPTGEGGWGLAYGTSKGAFHRVAGLLHAELRDRGIRVHNLDPGYVATESQREILGENDPIYRHQQRFGAPPEVPAAVVAWLATSPEAAAFAGRTIESTPFCKERGLLPGWPPQRPELG